MERTTAMDISENEKNGEHGLDGYGKPSVDMSEESTQEAPFERMIDDDEAPSEEQPVGPEKPQEDLRDDSVCVSKDSSQTEEETSNVKKRGRRKRESESRTNPGDDGLLTGRTYKLLTPEIMKEVIEFILPKCSLKNGEPVPAFGTYTQASDKFGIPKTTIRSVWERAKRKAASDSTDNSFQIQRFQPPLSLRHNSGRKKKWNRDQISQAIVELPFHQRKSVSQVGEALKIPNSSLHDTFASEKLVPTLFAADKPKLSEQNKYFRLLYAVERIRRNLQGNLEYDLAAHEVHLDERWFHITAKKDPDINNDAAQSIGEARKQANSLPSQKIMFLTAVARPRFDRNGNCTFDGKIGMWSFVQNHVPETKTPAGSTRQDVYLSYVLDKVMPAIQAKWPTTHHTTSVVRVALQHDNALSHFHKEHEKWKEFVASVKEKGPIQWHFSLNEQPANSPEMHVLQYRFLPRLELCQDIINSPATPSGEELIAHVESVWDNYLPLELNHDFLTHQACLDEIIACYGDNDFTVPQWGKEQEEKKPVLSKLPWVLPVSDKAQLVLQDIGFSAEEFPDLPILGVE